jgi:hypothetical protein
VFQKIQNPIIADRCSLIPKIKNPKRIEGSAFGQQKNSQTQLQPALLTEVRRLRLSSMAKKKQNKEKKVQDATTLARINFLHQAAHIIPLPLQRHYLTTSKVAMKKTMLKLYLHNSMKLILVIPR